MADEKNQLYEKRIVWAVRDYSKVNLMNGKNLKSPPFNIIHEGILTKWEMWFYPNGCNVEAESHVSLFLKLIESNSNQFDVKFMLGLLGKSNEKNFMKSAAQKSGENFSSLGYQKFIHHDQLFNADKGFIIDNVLTILCEIKISTPLAKTEKALAHTDFEPKTIDGKSLLAHKIVLIARSPVFLAMLNSNMQEAKQRFFSVPDFDSKVMKEVLRFIYCNEIKNLDAISRDLIFAAEKYQLDELKEMCVESIIKTLSVANVLKSLIISERVSKTGKLYIKCLDVIDSNFHTISRTSEWQKLTKEVLLKITSDLIGKLKTTINI